MENEGLTKDKLVSFTPADLEKINQAAKQANMSVSRFIREAAKAMAAGILAFPQVTK